MNKFISLFIIMFMAFHLAACGQGNNGDTKQGESEIERHYQMKIPVDSDEEAVRFVHEFVAEHLDETAYAGLYLEHEPTTHLILLIQQDHFNQEVADQLEIYGQQYSNKDPNYIIEMKPAKYSYQTLETVMNKLSSMQQELLDHPGKVFSFGINEMANRVDLHVSKKEDINQEVLKEITEGDSAILHITEGITSHVDQDGIPLEKPYIVGTIMDLNEETRTWLIDDQIYFSIDDGTLLLDEQGNPLEETDFQVGDQVKAWADGPILESFPAQGYAAVIQRNE